MPVVPLNLPVWRELYPDYGTLSDALLHYLWGEAGLLVGNSDASPIPETPRAGILNRLLCHLAELQVRGAGSVGRVNTANQGSVTAGLDFAGAKNSAWWLQTQCGATAWQMLRPWRTGGCWFAGSKN